MLVCNCTLAGTKACQSCEQYLKYFDVPDMIVHWGILPRNPNIPKTITTVREYNEKGDMVKETVTERTNE